MLKIAKQTLTNFPHLRRLQSVSKLYSVDNLFKKHDKRVKEATHLGKYSLKFSRSSFAIRGNP